MNDYMTIYNFGIDYIFETRAQAEEILDKLREVADMYGFVTQNDFVDLVGLKVFGYDLYSKFGLTKNEMITASVVRARCGYLIEAPNIHKLNENDLINEEPERADEESVSNNESVFITIHVNEIDVYDPGEIIADVFNQIDKIKDRTINITIM